jgi:hypothetical protein
MWQLSDLDSVIIPRFEFPWSGACHPQAAEAEATMIGWGVAYGLIPTGDYRDRVGRARYAYLAARCYPHANRELLQAMADFFLWFFIVDDLFVDRVETANTETLAQLTSMIDVLDFGRLGAPIFGQRAWLDVCRRLRRALTAEVFDRFATGMRMWASTAGLQIINHLQQQPLRMRHYETIRRHTSGMNPCLALVDVANAGAVTANEYHHPSMQKLRYHTNSVVCWANDIQSLRVETQQPGQYRNMVTIYLAQGYRAQEAIDITARRVRQHIRAFGRLARIALDGANPAVAGAIRGYQDWMTGYQSWVEDDTRRYATEHASQDADDRQVPLLPG